MVDRISTSSQSQSAIENINRLRADLAKLSDQISSGRKAKTFTDLGSDITRSLDLESSINATSRFINSNNTVISRLKLMDLAVSNIEQVASDLASNIVLEKSNGSNLNITEFARSALNKIQDSLNTNQNGRFLFSGGKTDRKAVEGLTINTNLIDGDPTANYYQGDDLTFSVRASKELDVQYGIKANDPAFQKLIGALNKVIQAEQSESSSSTSNNVLLGEATDLVNEAVSELASVRNKMNSSILTLQGVNTQHGRVSDQLSTTLSDLTSTDIVGASIEVSNNEAILQAVMQTFVSLSNLTLSDFLR